MDSTKQIDQLRDLVMIEAKKNPRSINGRVYYPALLLSLSVLLLLFSYFLSCLPCYFSSINISSAELVINRLINKRALFLFSNFIFILLVVDFTLSSPSNSFVSARTLHDHNSARLGGHLPCDSNAVVVADARVAEEQLRENLLWISNSLEIGEVVSSEQETTVMADSYAEEEKLAKVEENTANIDHCCGDYSTGMGDDIERRRPEHSNRSQQGRRMKSTVERGAIPPTLEVVVADDVNGEERTKLEAFGMEDEMLERLELDELNRKFDEFIRREKNKWRSEALRAASHGPLMDWKNRPTVHVN